jgi:hypothetical protein
MRLVREIHAYYLSAWGAHPASGERLRHAGKAGSLLYPIVAAESYLKESRRRRAKAHSPSALEGDQ